MSIQVNEVCKVRCDAVQRSGAGYTLAVFKRMNKKTARVVLYDDWLANAEAVAHTVTLNTLWRIKAKQRAQLARRARRAAKPPPLFTRVESLVSDLHGVHVVARLSIGGVNTKLFIGHDSVVNFTGDAIVNAANEGCLGGGGIDGEINRRGGPVLHDARNALPELAPYKRCDTGDAKITVSGNLPCDKVIHAVGPRFGCGPDHSRDLDLLQSAYASSLERAREAKLKSVGFCLLSAGIFSGMCPLKDILRVGIQTLASKAYPELETIVLCGFTQQERELLVELVEEIRASAN